MTDEQSVVIVTETPDAVVGMLHDMVRFLTSEGFDPFMEWMERDMPVTMHAFLSATGIDSRTVCRTNLENLHTLIDEAVERENADSN